MPQTIAGEKLKTRIQNAQLLRGENRTECSNLAMQKDNRSERNDSVASVSFGQVSTTVGDVILLTSDVTVLCSRWPCAAVFVTAARIMWPFCIGFDGWCFSLWSNAWYLHTHIYQSVRLNLQIILSLGYILNKRYIQNASKIRSLFIYFINLSIKMSKL